MTLHHHPQPAAPDLTAYNARWIEHDGLSIPKFSPGTLVTLRFADGFVEDRPCNPDFWSDYWLRRWHARNYINGYRIAAVGINKPARLDQLAALRKKCADSVDMALAAKRSGM